MLNAAAELSVLEAVLHFFTYAVMAVFAENIVFSHGLGVSHLLKLVETRDIRTLHYCLPILLVQLLSAPLVWAARVWFTPWVRTVLPGWLPAAALRPVIYLTCATIAMAVVWLLFRLFGRHAAPYLEQLPLATYNCCVLGTILICVNQNFTLLETVAFSLGSGLGYLFAVAVVDEGRRRLRSKDVPAIFTGMPISLIYIGILALAIYGLVGHSIVLTNPPRGWQSSARPFRMGEKQWTDRTLRPASARRASCCPPRARRWRPGPASPWTSLPPSRNTGARPRN